MGGPPCQPWSEGGKQLGLNDERGRLFFDYIKLIEKKRPKFFIIENVRGIINDKHYRIFLSFLTALERAGYVVSYSLLNAADYHIPQDRLRVFIVGFIKELNVEFSFPKPLNNSFVTLIKAIGDISEKPRFYNTEPVDKEYGEWTNHDVFTGPFDAKFMARNRVRSWNEVSFTIQAQAKNCPLHPQAPIMKYISPNQRIFVPGYEHLYRRLSVRECARIQSFPDNFRFFYTDIKDGYKMVGNAVPPRLARCLALSIKEALDFSTNKKKVDVLVAYYKNEHQLRMTLKNKLFYVRTGSRRGSLKFKIGAISPKYLLLHNRNNRFLYAMVEKSPQIMSASELSYLGFIPSGNEYLVFNLKDTERISVEGLDLEKVVFRGGERDISIPYITNIQDLILSQKK